MVSKQDLCASNRQLSDQQPIRFYCWSHLLYRGCFTLLCIKSGRRRWLDQDDAFVLEIWAAPLAAEGH